MALYSASEGQASEEDTAFLSLGPLFQGNNFAPYRDKMARVLYCVI